MCSSIILGRNVLMKQVGYRIGNSSYCQACTNICRQGQNVISKITNSEIYCMCHEQKDIKCVFANCDVEMDNTRRFTAITDMIRENANEYVDSEKKKLKEFENQIESRNFKFETSYNHNKLEYNLDYKEFNNMKTNQSKQKSILKFQSKKLNSVQQIK